MQMIFLTILINVAAISVWSVVTGQNGFKEAAKMLRGEAAFIRTGNQGGVTGKQATGSITTEDGTVIKTTTDSSTLPGLEGIVKGAGEAIYNPETGRIEFVTK